MIALRSAGSKNLELFMVSLLSVLRCICVAGVWVRQSSAGWKEPKGRAGTNTPNKSRWNASIVGDCLGNEYSSSLVFFASRNSS
jgi:hypothetical protein